MEKLTVSSQWTPEERASVIEVINAEKSRLSQVEVDIRKNSKWGAPVLVKLEEKQALLDKLIEMVRVSSSQHLEINRSNFSGFVQ